MYHFIVPPADLIQTVLCGSHDIQPTVGIKVDDQHRVRSRPLILEEVPCPNSRWITRIFKPNKLTA
jgi:hypothetical protein